ncbi:MAG: hypothetical protein ACKO96_04345 [Flammeovirgaceae bacterium]
MGFGFNPTLSADRFLAASVFGQQYPLFNTGGVLGTFPNNI